MVRRLRGGIRPRDANALCALRNHNGPCNQQLDPGGRHALSCKIGGHVVRRHDRIVRWLAKWLQARTDADVLVEQVLPDPADNDRLDVTYMVAGRRVWIDVAVVSVLSEDPRHTARRARTDGVAARDAEQRKRNRYRGLATPFVVEIGGRPGDSARGVIARMALDEGSGPSADVAAAWQSLAAILQAETSEIEFLAAGWLPAERDLAVLWTP